MKRRDFSLLQPLFFERLPGKALDSSAFPGNHGKPMVSYWLMLELARFFDNGVFFRTLRGGNDQGY